MLPRCRTARERRLPVPHEPAADAPPDADVAVCLTGLDGVGEVLPLRELVCARFGRTGHPGPGPRPFQERDLFRRRVRVHLDIRTPVGELRVRGGGYLGRLATFRHERAELGLFDPGRASR
jgi:hypothetical protein